MHEAVLFFKAHQKSRALWEKHGGKSLKLPPDTRFVYNFIMVLALKADKACARKTVVDDAYDPWLADKGYKALGKTVASRMLSESFWQKLDLVCKIAEPLVRTCKKFDSATPIMGHIHGSMLELQVAVDNAGLSATRLKVVQKTIKERWEYFHSAYHGAGFVLRYQAACRATCTAFLMSGDARKKRRLDAHAPLAPRFSQWRRAEVMAPA